ncbi:MAG: hypothetical protein KGL12_06465 [Rhodospirillales bacterium]|nr:hypothetical protein [Rhodospirillales bacterium]
MKRDARGLMLATDSDAAVAALDLGTAHYLMAHADTMALINAAIAADPGCVLARCMRAGLLLTNFNRADRAAIAACLDAATAHAARATPRERMHLAAVTAWQAGDLPHAFAVWRQLLADYPTDLFALRLADNTLFRHGMTRDVRAQAEAAAPFWSPALPGYHSFATIRAFAQEEDGETAPAEAAIDAALAEDPTHYFAHHVKAHLLERGGRAEEGAAFMAAQVAHWGKGSNLIHHLWWHRALLDLECRRFEAVLALYDAEVRNLDAPMTRAAPDHFVDLVNATSLLWRLSRHGVAVGARWEELADKAEARAGDPGHILLLPHLMMALVAAGRIGAARHFLNALRDAAPGRWNADALGGIVLTACAAVLAHGQGEHARVVALLGARRAELRALGGSNAQRDVVLQMLLVSAMRSGARDLVAAMLGDAGALYGAPAGSRIGYAEAAQWHG